VREVSRRFSGRYQAGLAGDWTKTSEMLVIDFGLTISLKSRSVMESIKNPGNISVS